jgi:hypothetical protein
MNILKKKYAFGVEILVDGEVTDKCCGIKSAWFWANSTKVWHEVVDIYHDRYKGSYASFDVIFNHFNRV